MHDDYLINLKKWQARSHPKLGHRQPSDLFSDDFIERYQRLHNDLWYRIIRLHGTIRTLEQLRDFPFDQIYAPNGMEFWRLVHRNFLEMTIILIHGMVNDQTTDAHTIRKFKNSICKEQWKDKNLHVIFQDTLRTCKFDKCIDSVAKRVTNIRHQVIAHRLVDEQTGLPKEQLSSVNFQELQQLFGAVHDLFGALSFGTGYATLAGDLMPTTIGGKPTRTCLDEVFDAILKDSYWINEPEKDQWWEVKRQGLPSEELQLLNKYRKSIGLPEV